MGGHEIMAIKMMRALKKWYSVEAIVCENNTQFRQALEKEKIHFFPLDYKQNSLQSVRNFISFRHKKQIKEILLKTKSDAIVLVQGNIDLSLIGGYAGKELNIPSISYIPLTQPLKRVSKNKIIGHIKDLMRTRSYSIPDYYITISSAQKSNLNNVVPNKPVDILSNYVDTSLIIPSDKIQCRNEFGIPIDKKVIGFVGRFEAWHKGLDRYCEYLTVKASHHPEVFFLFVGSGDYAPQIERLAVQHPNIMVMSWMNDLSKIYSLVDAIIMPSRYEGVSLTMLEALYLGIPIIANDIPEFREFIASSNLFNIDDDKSLDDKLQKLMSGSLKEGLILPDKIPSENDFEANTLKIFRQLLC